MRNLVVFFLLAMTVFGCGHSTRTSAPLVSNQPTKIFSISPGVSFVAAIHNALAAADTVVGTPDHGLLYTWYTSSHSTTQPSFTVTDGVSTMHDVISYTNIWDHTHRALWCGYGALRILTSDGHQAIDVIPDGALGGFLDGLSLTTDSRPCGTVRSNNGQFGWFNDRNYFWVATNDDAITGSVQTIFVNHSGTKVWPPVFPSPDRRPGYTQESGTSHRTLDRDSNISETAWSPTLAMGATTMS